MKRRLSSSYRLAINLESMEGSLVLALMLGETSFLLYISTHTNLCLVFICFGLHIKGTDYKNLDATCIRDYIDVTYFVDARSYLEKAKLHKIGIFNVGTRKVPVGEGDCGSLKEQRSITWKEGHEIRRGVHRCKQDQSGQLSIQILKRFWRLHGDGKIFIPMAMNLLPLSLHTSLSLY
ncbi:LOW QUALITY PROTEIN: hypothetical protein HID58_056569 [Brassica napus]|uniref:Uncharacterized protein n=1 Tax=Brassica napus TaxID=3708 RepID=A0ABQ8ANQ1_BRANA|nr:LOW QUALITY PROTEIN: hypothetical protein HID58_056569 [Brassica napus]